MKKRTAERNKRIFEDYDKLISQGYTRKYCINKLHLKYSIDLGYNIQKSTLIWLLDNRKKLSLQ